MKRSEINNAIHNAMKLFDEYKISLPPFVNWTPAQWQEKGTEAQEIRDNMLGWDITDFGQGDFSKIGLFLITIRNGNQKNPEKYPKTYAEKLMVVQENQITPMHFHWNKMEDIINCGGGKAVRSGTFERGADLLRAHSISIIFENRHKFTIMRTTHDEPEVLFELCEIDPVNDS